MQNKWSNRETVMVRCSNCGVEFEKLKTAYLSCSKDYCTKECAGLAGIKWVTVACAICGKKIERTPSIIANSSIHFCGKKHSYAYQAIRLAKKREKRLLEAKPGSTYTLGKWYKFIV